MTFDMRGWRASEVSDRLDRYLNDAYLAGLRQVRLLHGKGTGALRQVVRDVLQGHPLITSFTSAAGRDGGDGVTVASPAEAPMRSTRLVWGGSPQQPYERYWAPAAMVQCHGYA